MKSFLTSIAIALAIATAVSASAAPPVKKVQVSLEGEADQPMKIAVDTQAVKAGTIEFDVTNNAIGTDHEVVLVKLHDKNQTIAADAKNHRIDEKKLHSMGEVAGLRPGKTGILKVKLAAGDYLLLCNHKSHFELGMATPFTVTN